MRIFLLNLIFISAAFFVSNYFIFHSFENSTHYYFTTGITCVLLAFIFSFDDIDLWQLIKKLFKKSIN